MKRLSLGRFGAPACAIVAAIFALPVFPAAAATITFESVALPPSGSQVPVTPYFEAGFTLTNLQGGPTDGIFGPASGANTNGTQVFGLCDTCLLSFPAGNPTFLSNVARLTAIGGATFSLHSFDAAILEPGLTSGLTLIVVGHLAGGGTITTYKPLSDSWTTFLYSPSTLVSVDFLGNAGVGFSGETAIGPNLALDNLVVVSNTPLPAALPLFATGLGALGVLGWRRKRKNAAAVAAT